MIDVHVISRDGWVNGALAEWLSGHGAWTLIQSRYCVAQARNRSVKQFLAGPAGWLLQIDADLIPMPETAAILRVSDAHWLAYCAYPPRTRGPGMFTGYLPGCARMARDFLAGVSPPWFEPALNEDGSTWAPGQSEETKLLKAAKAVGIEPVRVGFAGHLVDVVLRYENGRIAW